MRSFNLNKVEIRYLERIKEEVTSHKRRIEDDKKVEPNRSNLYCMEDTKWTDWFSDFLCQSRDSSTSWVVTLYFCGQETIL